MRPLLAFVVVSSTHVPASACPSGMDFSLGVVDGSTLPVRGSFFVDDRWWLGGEPPDVPEPAAMRSWTTTRLSGDLRRIDYDAVDDAVVDIADSGQSYRLRFDANWQVPRASPRVLKVDHIEDDLGCMSSERILIELDQPVAAVRVRWTRNDLVETIYVPWHGTTFDLRESIDLFEAPAGGLLVLTAIRHDGSEVVIEGLPHRFALTEPASDGGNPAGFVAHVLLLLALLAIARVRA